MSASSARHLQGGMPSPPTTVSGSSRSRRGRRMDASESSESSLGMFDISNVKFRVMTPPRPMPLVSYSLDAECLSLLEVFGDEFVTKAVELAVQFGIPEPSIDADFLVRVFRDDPTDTQPTILIGVDLWTEDSPSIWQAVVEKLKKYIDQRITETEGVIPVDISVEMLHSDLLRQKYISTLDDDAQLKDLQAAWSSIKGGVYRILEYYTSTAGHLVSISVFKLGFDDRFNNPKTVYITLDYDSPEAGWPPVLNALQTFVDTFRFDLHVHLEHNILEHLAFKLLPPNDLTAAERDARVRHYNYEIGCPYRTAVRLGDDISAGCYIQRPDGKESNPLVGTLGCWIEVNVQGRGWTKMGLTNYHVVRPCLQGYTLSMNKSSAGNVTLGNPQKDSELWLADREGFGTVGTARRHQLEHPARAKHNFTLQGIKNRIRYLEERNKPVPDELITELNDMIAHFDTDQQFFGRPCFGSGYMKRTKTNGRLDWAMIKPSADDRVGGNALPSGKDWSAFNLMFDELPISLGSTMGPQTRSIRNFSPNERVFKVGASTKCTIGALNAIKTDCIMREEKYMPGRSKEDLMSSEYIFIHPRDMVFANVGDSGAVVWDEDGGVVGLLFRGQQPHGTKRGYGMVTPIEDVFESIKEMSMGHIVDVRILTT